MKTLKQFQCEICNTVYNSESECHKCERTHKLPVEIIGNQFDSYKNKGEYPESIKVKMSDGKEIIYTDCLPFFEPVLIKK